LSDLSHIVVDITQFSAVTYLVMPYAACHNNEVIYWSHLKDMGSETLSSIHGSLQCLYRWSHRFKTWLGTSSVIGYFNGKLQLNASVASFFSGVVTFSEVSGLPENRRSIVTWHCWHCLSIMSAGWQGQATANNQRQQKSK